MSKTQTLEPSVEAHLGRLEVLGRHDVVELVDHPAHYNAHPSGVECIDVINHMPFSLGNAFKYLFRVGLKDSDAVVRDLHKALWYLREAKLPIDRELIHDAVMAVHRTEESENKAAAFSKIAMAAALPAGSAERSVAIDDAIRQVEIMLRDVMGDA